MGSGRNRITKHPVRPTPAAMSEKFAVAKTAAPPLASVVLTDALSTTRDTT